MPIKNNPFWKISKIEKINLLVVATLLIIISILPNILGRIFTPDGYNYIGLRSLAPGDLFVYFSYINQIKAGSWLLTNFFTGEYQAIGMFNIWWLGVGVLAKIINLSAEAAFVMARAIVIPFLVIVFYLFCSYFIKEIGQKITCLWLGFFSGGIGFFYIIFNPFNKNTIGLNNIYNWPVDLWITEATLFNATFFSPLVSTSFIFTMLILLLMLLAIERKNYWLATLAGILALVYFNFHPYYWPIIIAVPAFYFLLESLIAKKINWRIFWSTIILFFISLPSIIYHWWLLNNEPVIGLRALQNVTLMPKPLYLLIGFGFLWVGFIIGAYFLYKKKMLNNRLRFLLVWLLVLLTATYSPLPFQSRYVQGMQIILIIFTVYSLWFLKPIFEKKLKPATYQLLFNNKPLLILLFLLVFSMSVMFNIFRDFYYIINARSLQSIFDNYYISDQDFLIIKYLKDKPVASTLILSSPNHGKSISAFSLQKSFVSHSHETLFFDSKYSAAGWFFGSTNDAGAKKKFLEKNKITHIVAEKKYDFEKYDYLKKIISGKKLDLYEFIKN